MKLDAHQHFWRYNPAEHTWMSEEMAALKRDFFPPDLKPLLNSLGFDGCIAVQARQSPEETAWLLDLAEKNDWIRAVVGWVDLRSKGLPKQLENFAKHPRLAGVRHVLHDEPNDEFMLRPDFRRGLAQLCDYNLTYDLLLFPKHLPIAAKLVADFPEQPFVLDHIAKPNIREALRSPWAEDIHKLAQYENVACKLSGMVTEARWKQWTPADFRPYLDTVVRAFGPNRLMIGSDWPVCTLSADYASTMNIVLDSISQFPAEAQAKILGENAARIYKISSSP
jgi:L-fuconolactonase